MHRDAERAAILSVIVTIVLTGTELAAGFWSGAISVVANAVQSAIDLLSALTAWVAIRQGAKPPDADHHYGHGKFESLWVVLQALMIWAISAFIAVEAIQKWRANLPVTHPPIAVGAMVFSVVLGGLTSRYLFAVASRTGSLALKADAYHLWADAGAAAVILVGLIILAVTGWQFVDSLLALMLSVWIVRSGWQLMRQAMAHLLDTALPSEEVAVIEGILHAHADQFLNAHRLRTRRAGNRRYVDLHLVVPDAMTVQEAHHLCDAIEADIHKALPNTDVTIHVEPESAFRQQGMEDRTTFIVGRYEAPDEGQKGWEKER
jgi:cation diffusion facilitator family transporter